MKRVLSWVALALVTGILSKLAQIIYQLLFAGIAYTGIIPDDISLFSSIVALVLIVGSGLYVTYLIAKLAICASQAIKPSEGGTRYSVYGTILICINLVSFIAVFGVASEYPLVNILGALLLISQGAMIAILGSAAKEKRKDVSKSTDSKPEVSSNNSLNKNSQRETQFSEAYRIFVRTMIDETGFPESVCKEAYVIDQMFTVFGKDAGINRMRKMEDEILLIDNTEDFARRIPEYAYICGLMVSLGHLTKSECDEMVNEYTKNTQRVALILMDEEHEEYWLHDPTK